MYIYHANTANYINIDLYRIDHYFHKYKFILNEKLLYKYRFISYEHNYSYKYKLSLVNTNTCINIDLSCTNTSSHINTDYLKCTLLLL